MTDSRPGPTVPPESDLGVVVIGRNEGERLVRCLASSRAAGGPVVYVDSGSTDQSVAAARAAGAEVVGLDADRPFTPARGRNAGLDRLATSYPGVSLVLFVDGDCELAPGWAAAARQALAADPTTAVVCGRRRERRPQASRYNRLCDLEWDTPVGPAAACGGDAVMRVAVVRGVGGFRDALMAGEEPDLCARLRAAGWGVARVDAEMTTHDAAITRFGQWWRRTTRTGYGLAEVSALHERVWQREVRSNWAWGAVAPGVGALAVVATAVVSPLAAAAAATLGVATYAVLVARIYRHGRRRGWSSADARLYATFTVLAKFPLAVGQAKYRLARLTGRAPPLIEYKVTEAVPC